MDYFLRTLMSLVVLAMLLAVYFGYKNEEVSSPKDRD